MNYSPKQIVFFIDRCLGKKLILDRLRKTGITVKIHDDCFPQNAKDIEWIPEVGKREWIILTKDANIGKNQLERLCIAQAKIRMFTLASQNLSGEEMANIFEQSIISMQRFIEKNPAPFIAKIYRDSKVKPWKNQEDLLAELDNFLND